MAKFKNKKNGVVIEENLLYYINKLKNNVNFKEMKEEEKTSSPDKLINKKEVAK